MNPIGLGILVSMAYFGYRGYERGLIEEVGRLVGLVLAIILANRFSTVAAQLVGLDNEFARKAVAFVVIFILTLVAVGLIARALHSMLELALMGWLDDLGGTVFGLLKSLVVIGVMIYVIESFETTAKLSDRLKEQSFVYRNVVVVRDGIFTLFSLDDMIRDVHNKVKEIDPEDLVQPLIQGQ
ncbi:CvpA family protein [Candidatus Neomarinimicrobiota bacterium]